MKKSTRFKYVVHDKLVFDRALPMINKVNDIYFSLGDDFDHYDFKRKSTTAFQVEQAIEQRVHSLRQKHEYLRLWFGGGRDCRLILDSFIKHNVQLDEIVVMRRCTKHNLGLNSNFDPLLEIDSAAVNFLNKNAHLFPNTKITIVDFDDAQHEVFFEQSGWYTHTSEWFFSVGYLPKIFHQYANLRFNFLDVTGKTCELIGSSIPTVWYDESSRNWNFNFSCSSFSCVGPDFNQIHYEDFLISDECPELFELHVNSIIDDYEQSLEYPNYSKDFKQQERDVRNRSLFFKNCEYHEFQIPKTDLINIEFPSDHYFWRASQSSRTYYEMINRWHQVPMSRCLDLYINNTDWKLIEKHIKRPFKTKTWTLTE